MTKKIFTQPELQVVRFGADIHCQDVIAVSNTLFEGPSEQVLSGGRRFDDWDTGY